MIKVDLHSHSTLSHDGGINESGYKKILDTHILDCIAITDHNEIAFAQQLHHELGEKIIVGEEIMTTEGEIIGLFLSHKIEPYHSPKETIAAIKEQNGIVYIPHPFESLRKGISLQTLTKIQSSVDILEVFNARAKFDNKSAQAQQFAIAHAIPQAVSNDAHCVSGVGYSWIEVANMPTSTTLISHLKQAKFNKKQVPMVLLLCPKVNKGRKLIKKFLHG